MSWKRWLLGTPLETERFREERLRVPIALAVFSSDALSSVAYATEEILLVLSIAGASALHYSLPISAVIALLLWVVIISYRQTIYAYPEGGGSYIVARENLGTLWGLIAAAALLLDYILTVAVSTAAGVAAMTSAFPGLLHYRVGVGLLFLFLLAVGNLRGVRQSGRIFAVPTYMFIFSMTSLTGVGQTVVSQLGRAIFGTGLLYYLMQIATAAILMVAANTAFADFPRLSSILARDRFLPRQLANLGDRLVYSNGILILAGSAGFLLILFGGNTHRLIPLYAVGVFLAFTLSQAGMVARHLSLQGQRSRRHALRNAAGATATGAALLVIATTKFLQGAWIVILLIPLFVIFFLRTHRHYFYVRQQLSLREIEPERPLRHTAIVPISAVNRATVYAVRYAKSIAHEVEAVHVAIDPARVEQVRQQWKAWGGGVPLRVLESPYRSMVQPLVDHIDDLMHGRRRNEMVTVVLPEFVTAHWWEGLFHNQSAFLIKGALLFRPGVVVTSIPFHFSR